VSTADAVPPGVTGRTAAGALRSAAPLRYGDRSPAVRQVRRWLSVIGALPPADSFDEGFDEAVRTAVLAFQQDRGLRVDGVVGTETYRSLEEARWSLGDRLLFHQVGRPFAGDDVLTLQRRLLQLGFDAGRCDAHFGPRTESALRDFQRNYGLPADGTCGPQTLRALRQLSRSVVGGRVQGLREAEALRGRGPSVSGRSVVIDAGHGGPDEGWRAGGLCERDICADLARRLEGRLVSAGMSAPLTHGPDGNPVDAERAAFANATGADLLVSLHTDGSDSPHAQGVACYYYGTGRDGGSIAGEHFAELVQREITARTDLVDARTHAKTWELLRLTRMPAVRVELGYLTNGQDAQRLASAELRETVAEAIMVAVHRVFLPLESDLPTGALRLPSLSSRSS
jgi:N-acetylmuramoyl-L-alanine amidase